ncbi:MAG: LexA family transcriptional regulator, partial [Bacteroidales bacterium]|nr:LexA family transcriptional regulator [Bacteroidales bacterium]
MAEQGNKGKRGGRRQGAGRPKGTSRSYNFRADKEVADYIDRQENKTGFIKECISFTMRHRSGATEGAAEVDRLAKLGEVIPAGKVKPMPLPFFDVKIVAGFPIPMNTDELAQDIELLQMLCPHPDSSYLIRVLGDSMIEADVKDGDILIVDK